MPENSVSSKLLADEILALTMWGEARNQSPSGQVAVANVIMNRYKNNPTKYRSIKDVCLEPLQFSCWNKSDPNYEKILEEAKMIINDRINDPILKQCLYIARGVINNYFLDNTKKALHYMTRELFDSDRRPKWAESPKGQPVVIGDHIFFNV